VVTKVMVSEITDGKIVVARWQVLFKWIVAKITSGLHGQ
jgi:hypothetical protein